MKTVTLKNLFYTMLLSVFFIGISVNGYAQCGAEAITTTQWCENGFAKWSFNSPTPNTWYEWYSYTPAPYVAADFDANGHLIRTGSIFYDSTQSSSYYSPFRITTATAPPAGVQLTYIKRTSYPTVNPKPGATPAYTSNASGTVMEMSFTNTMPVRFNSIKVPVILNTVGQTYKIQITFGTTGGPGSAVYNFSTVGATPISGVANGYYIEVPINYTLTTTGTTKIVVNSNPTGAGSAVDGLLFSPAQPATTTSGPITIPANSASTTGGKFGVLYDWNYTAICPPQTTPLSTKTTVGCCVAPASINILTLSSNKATIVNGSGTAVLTVGNYSSTSNYFDWYFNGVNVPAASGVGKTTYTTNQVGNWEVHELTGASPSAADKTNPSCYSSDATRIDDKLIFASIVTSPSTSCIGDTWSLSGSGSSNLTWSTGGGTLSNTTGPTTNFTASQAGTTQVILTGTVTSGDLVTNGNFSAGTTGFVTSMPGPVDPRSTDGSYNVASSAGNWGAQGDWTFNGTKPFVTGNPGNFLIVNGEDASSIAKPVVWGQNITGLTANQAYTFSFDFTSICYVVSANTGGYSNAPGTAPFYDVELEVYINGVLVGSASTDFATNGGVNAVGVWKNYAYTWNSATSSFANIEIRQKNLFPMRGYDFGLDNIKFGGLQTQTDAVTIGPITDCSAITATASACVNDSYTDLTAVASGGLIFDHWELTSTHATVSTANPYRVQTLTATQYDAVGYMGIGNVLSNGDFNSGNIGFISGGTYYTYAGTGHGDNQYSVDVSISTHNAGWWIDIPQAPGQSATSMRYIADAKTGVKVLAWTFTANQNDKFAFSGYMANIHKDALGPDTTNTGIPSAIGIYINNVMIASYWTKNDRDWHQLTGNWTAPLAGSNTYTLEVRNLKLNSGGGNDFALDDFKLVPLTGTPKKFTVTTPVCNPCLINLPTLGSPNTFCANTGIVHLTPNASEPNGIFDWYDALTAGNKLGTSQGIDPDGDTLNVSTAASSGANKIVYYQKTAKGAGTVFKKAQSCDSGFDDTWENVNSGGRYPYEQRYTSTIALSITEFTINFRSEMYNTGDVKNATLSFSIVGSKTQNGGLVADLTNVYGTFTKNWTRTKTAAQPQQMIEELVFSGSASVPAGNFFIVMNNATSSGNGNLAIGRSDCKITVPIVDDFNGTTVSRTGAADGYGNPRASNDVMPGLTYNVKFSVPAYACPRTPVTLTPSCPCNKPTSVTVNGGTSPINKCVGDPAFTTSGSYVNAGSPVANTSMAYVWYKQGTTPGAYTNLPAPTPVTTTASQTVTARSFTAPVVADAGTWILRVEDGNTGNSSCYTEGTVVLNVNPLPTISGTLNVCIGSTTTLTGSGTAAASNAWVSATPAVATVNATTGVVTGVTAGTSVITYTNNNGCSQTATVTVNALPTISGTLNVCIGSTTTLTGSGTAAASNAWVSATPAVATVNATTGVVTGVTAGTSVITYTNNNGCKQTATVTVNALPTISGTLNVCIGSTTTLTGSGTAAASNAWVSASTAVATVNATTGVVTGVTAGTSVITYTNNNGCSQTATVTVNALPTISGTLNVCIGSTTTLTGSGTAATSNAWVSASTAVATVNATTGVVTGVTAGTSVITYTNNNGCSQTATVTVNALPTISGTLSACVGSTTTLTGSGTAAASNAWVSATPAVATVNATTGVVTGVTAGTSVITYTNNNGCKQTATVTINALPTISGTLNVCIGSTTTLTGSGTAAASNAWVSATPAVATVNATTGVVTGVTAGTSVITYTNNNGCSQTATVTVNALPTISGTLNVCIGSTTTLTGSGTAAASNAWVSATPAVATVNATTGVVTGVTAGTSVITYTNNNGCSQTATVTVNALPTISGTLNVCVGLTTTLTGSGTAAASNAWVSASTAVATVNATTGVVTGVTAGTSVITYTNNNGCKQTATVTVNALPTISGTLSVCKGLTTQLTGSGTAAASNAWVSATPAVATVNATTGLVTGVTPGTSVITYTNNNGCIITATVTVNDIPTITGTLTVCIGSTTTLTGSGTPAASNAWVSATPAVATVNATTGVVTGVSGGTSVITYTNSGGCKATATVTVSTTAAAGVTITANPGTTICAGDPVTFTAAGSNGGTTPAPTYEWTSSAVGGILSTTNTYSSSALIQGEVITVKFTSSLSCAVPAIATDSKTMTVTPIPAPSVSIAVSPTGAICPNTNITFTATPTQGGGTPVYTWKRKPVSGPAVTVGTNSPTFSTTAAVDGDIYTVEMVSNAPCAPATPVTSNPITITVTPVPTLTVTAVSDKATICSGQTVIFTATPGGTGATPSPTYEWFIGTSTTAASTSNPFSTTSLTTTAALSPQTYSIYVKATSTATCASTTPVQSLPVTVTVNAGVGAGTITTATPTICYDAVPGAITEASAAVGVGAATYTWEETTDPLLAPSSWGPAQGTVTGTGFTPSGQKTGDIYYRRTVTFAGVPAPCNTSQSNTVHFTVRPQLVVGIIGTDASTCSGAPTSTMSETTAPTGGTGTYTYQWQSAPDVAGAPGTFTNITTGGTGATYNAGNLTQTMYYRLIETSCGSSVTTNIVTKTISAPEVVTVSINDPGQICASSGAFNFVASASTTGTGTLSYTWYLGPVIPANIVGTASSYSYTPVIGDNTKTVRVIVTTSNGCNAGPGTSNIVTLDIVNAITPTVTISGNPVNCAGLMNNFTLTSTGGGTSPGPAYQWYVIPSGGSAPGNAMPAATNTTYSNSALVSGDRVYVSMTSSSNCLASGLTNPFKSNEIVMQIKPIPTPSITEGDQTICSPNTFTFHGNVTAGNSYEWRQAPNNTVVGTGADFTATQSGTYMLYEDNGTCNSTSQPVTLNIVQTPIANAGADIFIKQGDIGTLDGSGGAIYSWSPATGLSSTTAPNPGFTATTTTTYILTVSDASNTCSTNDAVTVYVVKPIVVPNVITVNGDGVNDDWEIENIEGYPNVVIEIYNRWGNLVWKSEGYPKNWDGTNYRNGEVLADGTYFYIINLHSQVYDEPLTGWIQIVK